MSSLGAVCHSACCLSLYNMRRDTQSDRRRSSTHCTSQSSASASLPASPRLKPKWQRESGRNTSRANIYLPCRWFCFNDLIRTKHFTMKVNVKSLSMGALHYNRDTPKSIITLWGYVTQSIEIALHVYAFMSLSHESITVLSMAIVGNQWLAMFCSGIQFLYIYCMNTMKCLHNKVFQCI